MRSSKIKRDLLVKQNRQLKINMGSRARGQSSTDEDLKRQIEERVANGKVTKCPPSRRKVAPGRFRYDHNP